MADAGAAAADSCGPEIMEVSEIHRKTIYMDRYQVTGRCPNGFLIQSLNNSDLIVMQSLH